MRNAEKSSRAGAALVESCLAIIMLCLILFGILQVSYLIAAKDVISFSAFAACRSATVGMKDEFVGRVARTTSIPMAGPMFGSPFDEPVQTGAGQSFESALRTTPSSRQYWYEHDAIPYYLGAIDESELNSILNYYNWLHSDTRVVAATRHTGDSVEVYVSQNVPLTLPFARVFYRGNMGSMTRQDGTHSVPRSSIDADIQIENHSSLYLTEGN